MKKTKRLLLMTLVLCIFMMNFSPVGYGLDIAESDSVDSSLNGDINAITSALADIAPHASIYGYEDIDFNVVSVGTEVPVYIYDNNELQAAEFRMYPLFTNMGIGFNQPTTKC